MAATLEPDSPGILNHVRKAPLTFGSWRELKALYKRLEAEATDPARTELLAALIARLDAAPFAHVNDVPTVRLREGRGSMGQFFFAIRGSRGLVVQNEWNGATFRLVDFATPDRLRPRRGGTVEGPRSQRWDEAVFVGDSLAAVRVGNGRVQFVDIADFDAPRLRGTVGGKTLGRDLQSIAGGGDGMTLFAACGGADGGLRVISARDPDAPEIVTTLPLPGAARVAAVPGRPLVALLSRGPAPESLLTTLLSHLGVSARHREVSLLHLIDVSEPESPRIVGVLEINHADRLVVTERFAYVAFSRSGSGYGSEHGVRVVDIDDAQSPRLLGTATLPSSYYPVEHMAARDGYLYVAPRYSVVQVIDARDPAHPKMGRTMSGGYVNGLAIQGETLFVAGGYTGLTLWHLGDGPDTPMAYGMPPSAATLGYMKRRARRLLRTLARTSPERFVATAARVLAEARSPTLHPEHEWVSVDLLFGGGGRFEQTSHGRGHYKELRPRGLSIRRREERYPELWDAHPGYAESLFVADGTTSEAREMALRVLHAGGRPIPVLKGEVLGASLASGSLLLIAEAVRQAATRLGAGEVLPPVVAADAGARATPKWRSRLLTAAVAVAERDAGWAKGFTARLLTHLPDLRVSDAEPTRRAVLLAALFAEQFPEQATGAALVHLTPLLLRSGRPEAYRQLLSAAERAAADDLPGWLEVLERVPDNAVREAVLAALCQAVSGKALPASLYERAVTGPTAQAAWLWRLLAASAPAPGDTLKGVWATLLSDPSREDVLRAAMASADALSLLGRANLSDEEMAGYLRERPLIVDLLSPDAFARLTQTLPAALTLRLAAAASNEAWARLREGWLRNLREGIGLAALWTDAEAALKGDATGNLEPRLLGDPEVAETILDVDDAAAILEIREPSFGDLLGRYMARHGERIAASDALLLLAATHPLPAVRTPALDALRTREIMLPFALGLLESEVPASVTAGRAWFEAAAQPDLLDRALALCDSPAASVRAIGREFVTAHRDALPTERLTAALAEHGDPVMQEFVARLLGDAPAPGFDRDVLRTRHQARRAKEVVKRRQEELTDTGGGAVDVETLLALARGSSTPRDADWALSQLVRRALAGEQIEGLVIEGSAAATAGPTPKG
jgi:hypothetical protein